MPLEIELPFDEKSIELEEFVEIIDSHKYDFSNQDDIINSAPYLQQLNNNKKLLVKRIAFELKDAQTFQRSNLYGPRVFILLSHPKYYLRAVVWEPISNLERSIKGFNYDIYHDHNFDILTAGYFGPGYETLTYTYDYQNITGFLGEKIELKELKNYTLSEGKLLLYRAKKDIHIQLPPESLSISLNLIPKTDSVKLPQYQFNESTHTICRYLQNSGNELIVRMAGALGDSNMIASLDDLFEKTTSVHIRALTASSLIQLSPERRDEIYERVFAKNDLLLNDIFLKETAKAGASLGIFEGISEGRA